jgi:hypothetical protein
MRSQYGACVSFGSAQSSLLASAPTISRQAVSLEMRKNKNLLVCASTHTVCVTIYYGRTCIFVCKETKRRPEPGPVPSLPFAIRHSLPHLIAPLSIVDWLFPDRSSPSTLPESHRVALNRQLRAAIAGSGNLPTARCCDFEPGTPKWRLVFLWPSASVSTVAPPRKSRSQSTDQRLLLRWRLWPAIESKPDADILLRARQAADGVPTRIPACALKKLPTANTADSGASGQRLPARRLPGAGTPLCRQIRLGILQTGISPTGPAARPCSAEPPAQRARTHLNEASRQQKGPGPKTGHNIVRVQEVQELLQCHSFSAFQHSSVYSKSPVFTGLRRPADSKSTAFTGVVTTVTDRYDRCNGSKTQKSPVFTEVVTT